MFSTASAARTVLRSATYNLLRCRRILVTSSFQNSRRPSSCMSSQSRFVSQPLELGIVAAGTALGQTKHGVQLAPKFLIEGPLPDLLRTSCGLTLHGDLSNSSYEPYHKPVSLDRDAAARAIDVSNTNSDVSGRVYAQAIAGRKVLTLGGDHSTGIGSVSGIAKAVHEKFENTKRLGVVWVDAHADINTPQTSGSGNLHGMPLAFLSGIATSSDVGVFDWLGDEHKIDLSKLVYIGLRDLDEAEKKVIEFFNIKTFTPFDLTHMGIKQVMDEVLDYIGHENPIHLAFDIDGLDPSIAPSTGLPVNGGLTLREGQYIAERLNKSGQLTSMDVVEYNPLIGSESDRMRTMQSVLSVIESRFKGSVV